MFKNSLILLSFAMMVQPAFSMDMDKDKDGWIVSPGMPKDREMKFQVDDSTVRVQTFTLPYTTDDILKQKKITSSIKINERDKKCTLQVDDRVRRPGEHSERTIIITVEGYEPAFSYKDVLPNGSVNWDKWLKDTGLERADALPAYFTITLSNVSHFPDTVDSLAANRVGISVEQAVGGNNDFKVLPLRSVRNCDPDLLSVRFKQPD